MIIRISEKIIEIKADEGLYLKDNEGNTFEGVCLHNDGQTEEELKELFFEISNEEKEELELEQRKLEELEEDEL